MNKIHNDQGEYVVAVGAPGSVERAKVEWPGLIARITAISTEGEAWASWEQDARRMIDGAAILSELEKNSVMAAARIAMIDSVELRRIDKDSFATSKTTILNTDGNWYSVCEPSVDTYATILRAIPTNADGTRRSTELMGVQESIAKHLTTIMPVERGDKQWYLRNTSSLGDRLPLGARTFESVTEALQAAAEWHAESPAHREVIADRLAAAAFTEESARGHERAAGTNLVEAISSGPQEAIHTHDCDECVHLGSENSTDYYLHDSDELIARYGSEGPAYSSLPAKLVASMAGRGDVKPTMAKALELAVGQGKLKADGSPPVEQAAFAVSRKMAAVGGAAPGR